MSSHNNHNISSRSLLTLMAVCAIEALLLAGCTQNAVPLGASSTVTVNPGSVVPLDYHPAPGTAYLTMHSPDNGWQASVSEDENETQVTTLEDLRSGSKRTFTRAIPISFSPDSQRFIFAQSSPGLYGGLFVLNLTSSSTPKQLTNIGLADNDPATVNAIPEPVAGSGKWNGDLFIFSVDGYGSYTLNVVTAELHHEK